VDELSIEQMTGLARVCCISELGSIDRTLLSSVPVDGVSRLLLKTSNSVRLGVSSFTED
jgi:hypothetical protein